MKSTRLKDSEWIQGLTQTAIAIAEHFKIPCNKTNLNHWRKRTPPFPPPHPSSNNRYNRKACYDWVERNIVAPMASTLGEEEAKTLQQRAYEAELNTKITKSEQETKKLEKLQDKYIERTEARKRAVGAVKKYHSYVVGELEQNLPFDAVAKLKELGASHEIVASYFEWITKRYQASIDRIENRCEAEAKEADTIVI